MNILIELQQNCNNNTRCNNINYTHTYTQINTYIVLQGQIWKVYNY